MALSGFSFDVSVLIAASLLVRLGRMRLLLVKAVMNSAHYVQRKKRIAMLLLLG